MQLRSGDFLVILSLKSSLYTFSIFFFLNKVIIPHIFRFLFFIYFFFCDLVVHWCVCDCRRLHAYVVVVVFVQRVVVSS